jgi:selenocysteine lyase/cysteine desulfurase
MMELPSVKVDLLSTENILLKKSDFIQDLKVKLAQGPDLFFMSQVFFDSGIAFTDEELLDIAKNCPEKTLIVIDGYHGFAALPTNLSQVEGRIFYLAGGYKYAQAGEGACFLVVPKGNWRPAYTGWYAEFGDLSRPKGTNVGYTNNGMAFMGSTQDPSALYRFNSVWNLYQEEGITLGAIHKYVKDLQLAFIKSLPDTFLSDFKLRPLYNDLNWHGHFLTFESASELDAQNLTGLLKEHGIIVDRRGHRIRFGFGLYQDISDVMKLVSRLQKLADLNL